MALACIVDVAGERLSADEKAFFRATDPWAFILFGRSCVSPDQMRALTDEMREAVGRDALIFIDQEGGRVQRLKPPVWPQFPPCLDLRIEGAHSVIGNRAFSSDPDIVAALGRAAIAGLHAGGVASVIKHVPGHGRALADSHHGLPVLDTGLQGLAHDFAPFAALADAPMAMTAHIVYEALDAENPATLSATVIHDLVRGRFGFDGLLMTDDISMKALTGTSPAKAWAAISAGCDVAMLCNATLEDRLAFVAACPELSGKGLERAQAAEAVARKPAIEIDIEAAWARFGALTGHDRKTALSLGYDPTENR
ncbi:MAG: beta-hexosaminidase [Hyphomonadaceae bacterium]|nr:beta-hexosaminidase [Hyphomonadaceae bacterium]